MSTTLTDPAAEFFTEQGYTLLHRNFFTSRGEIDIILHSPDQETIVFVEVKWGRGQRYTPQAPQISPAKLTGMRYAAVRWLEEHPEHTKPHYRFDVLTITDDGFAHSANVSA